MGKRVKLSSFVVIAILMLMVYSIIKVNGKRTMLSNETASKITFESLGNISNHSIDNIQDTIINTTDKVRVFIETDNNTELEQVVVKDNITREEVQRLRKSKLEEGYKVFYQNNVSVASKLDINIYQDVHVSKYTPFISFEIDQAVLLENNGAVLKQITDNTSIKKVHVGRNKEIKNQFEDAIIGIEENDNHYSLGDYVTTSYRGRGVKIGMLEYGIVEVDHTTLVNCDNITCRDVFGYVETETLHATKVANILVGPNGIARESELYSVEWWGSPDGEIEWLLDQNVDIINVSAASSLDGEYDSVSLLFDYVSYTYNVFFAAACGNDGEEDGYVSNSAMGKNVMAVGACYPECDEISPISSYLTTNLDCKPNILAPGDCMNMPDIIGAFIGTSYAAPIVSAIAALLMEKLPSLSFSIPKLYTILQAGSNYDRMLSANIYGSYSRAGAGFLNFENSMAILNSAQATYAYVQANANRGAVITKEIYLPENYVLKMAATWTVKPESDNSSPSSVVLNRYYLSIKKKDSTYAYATIGDGTSHDDSNKLLLEYLCTSAGTYVITVGKLNSTDIPDKVGLAYRAYPET